MCVCECEQCCQRLGFCSKSQDFLSLNLLIIICKLSVLGFPFNMVPLSSVYTLTKILGFLTKCLGFCNKKSWQHCVSVSAIICVCVCVCV